MIWLLLPVYYWPIIMIGPGGLLLCGLQNIKWLNLDVRNIRTYWALLGNGGALSYRWFTYVTQISHEYLHHWILLASLI
jgi:hypothetical protein